MENIQLESVSNTLAEHGYTEVEKQIFYDCDPARICIKLLSPNCTYSPTILIVSS